MLPLSPEEQFEARADGFIFGLFQYFPFLHWHHLRAWNSFLVSGRALVIGLLASHE